MKEPATTWTMPGPSVGEHVADTIMPLTQISAGTGKLELIVTAALVVGALRTVSSTCTLTSMLFVPSVGRFAMLTFTSRDAPTVATNVGGVEGHTLPVVRVDGAIHTVVGPAAWALGLATARANTERISRIGTDRRIFFNKSAPNISQVATCVV